MKVNHSICPILMKWNGMKWYYWLYMALLTSFASTYLIVWAQRGSLIFIKIFHLMHCAFFQNEEQHHLYNLNLDLSEAVLSMNLTADWFWAHSLFMYNKLFSFLSTASHSGQPCYLSPYSSLTIPHLEPIENWSFWWLIKWRLPGPGVASLA